MLVSCAAFVACGGDDAPGGGADAAGGGPDAAGTPDAPEMLPDAAVAPDAPPVADASLAADAGYCQGPGGNGSMYRLYLNFEGATLQPSPNGQDDATMNITHRVTAQRVVPPFIAANPNRATIIAGIVAQVKSTLAFWDIDVVTTRPLAGDYAMVVFGGDSQSIIGQANQTTSFTFDCGADNQRDLALVYDAAFTSLNAVGVANITLRIVGTNVGMETVTTQGDCMCSPAASCSFGMTPCDYGVAPTGTMVCSDSPPGTSQDGPTVLAGTYGCSP
jgi:hypothetical protein